MEGHPLPQGSGLGERVGQGLGAQGSSAGHPGEGAGCGGSVGGGHDGQWAQYSLPVKQICFGISLTRVPIPHPYGVGQVPFLFRDSVYPSVTRGFSGTVLVMCLAHSNCFTGLFLPYYSPHSLLSKHCQKKSSETISTPK